MPPNTSPAIKTPDGMDFNVERYKERRRSLRDEFSTYKQQYAEIAENFAPRRGMHIRDGDKVDGKKRHQKIINSTVNRVSKNARSGLQAGVTSPSRPWKKLGPDDETINDIPGAKEFYAEIDRRMDFVLGKSNFYRATHTSYADFVNFGPAAVQTDEHADDTIRCQVHPIGSWVGASNADGRVNVFYRDYKPTAYEIIDRFGSEILPSEFMEKANKKPYARHELFNAIEPNPFYAGKGQPSIGLASFPYISVWWLKGHEQDFLKVHGYHEFPVQVFRFDKSENGDAYGYGAAADALGEGKQLQHQERTKLRGVEKMVEPPLQGPTSLKRKGISVVPNKITYHDGPGKIESLYNVNLPLQYVLQDIAEIQQRLSEAFFEDLFLMVSQGVNRQTTAREIEERHEEKLIMLGPVLESINDEFLDPVIDRVLGIMRRAGLFPEPPPELVGVEFKVEYISILAQAQRAIQTISIEQGINFAANTAQFMPEVLDRIDADETIEVYLNRIGFPPQAIRNIQDANGIRAERQQAQTRQANLDMAGQAAGMAKDVAESGATQPNVLQQLLSGAG